MSGEVERWWSAGRIEAAAVRHGRPATNQTTVRSPLSSRVGASQVIAWHDLPLGFACFVGRPNAGKSTLTNALVGTKVAITSERPQTTRHAIRGIVHRADAQLVLVDTPGPAQAAHPARPAAQRRRPRRPGPRSTSSGSACRPTRRSGRATGSSPRSSSALKTPVIAVVTKTDKSDKQTIGEQLLAVSALHDWADVVPVGAVSDFQVGLLADLLVARLPEGPALYPDGELTDEPERRHGRRADPRGGARGRARRAAALDRRRVEEMIPREDRPADRPLLDIYATLYVERDSQKAIVIGRKGARLATSARRRAATRSRRCSAHPVYLDLHVKVAKDWQRDPKQLRKLGFYPTLHLAAGGGAGRTAEAAGAPQPDDSERSRAAHAKDRTRSRSEAQPPTPPNADASLTTRDKTEAVPARPRGPSPPPSPEPDKSRHHQSPTAAGWGAGRACRWGRFPAVDESAAVASSRFTRIIGPFDAAFQVSSAYGRTLVRHAER